MAVSLSPIGGAGAQFFDNNGVPLAGGKLYSYEAGTTTPKTTYTSAAGTTANTNPIVLNAGGRPPQEIWLTTNEAYKFVLTDSAGTLIGTWDNIYGYSSGSIAYAATEVQTATAGQTLFILTEMVYNPGTNTLAVYVDGVNQVVENAYVETSSTSVTFMSGLHVGATVKFVNISIASSDATVVTYEPGFTGSVATTVAAKLQQTVSVKDFGAVPGDYIDDAIDAAMAAINDGGTILLNNGTDQPYKIGRPHIITKWLTFKGDGAAAFYAGGAFVYDSMVSIVVDDGVTAFIAGRDLVNNSSGDRPPYAGGILLFDGIQARPVTQRSADSCLLRTNSINSVEIRNCVVRGFDVGLDLTGCFGVDVHGNFFTENERAINGDPDYYLSIFSSGSALISGLENNDWQIYSNTFSNGNAAHIITNLNGRNVSVYGNSMENCPIGVSVSGYGGAKTAALYSQYGFSEYDNYYEAVPLPVVVGGANSNSLVFNAYIGGSYVNTNDASAYPYLTVKNVARLNYKSGAFFQQSAFESAYREIDFSAATLADPLGNSDITLYYGYTGAFKSTFATGQNNINITYKRQNLNPCIVYVNGNSGSAVTSSATNANGTFVITEFDVGSASRPFRTLDDLTYWLTRTPMGQVARTTSQVIQINLSGTVAAGIFSGLGIAGQVVVKTLDLTDAASTFENTSEFNDCTNLFFDGCTFKKTDPATANFNGFVYLRRSTVFMRNTNFQMAGGNAASGSTWIATSSTKLMPETSTTITTTGGKNQYFVRLQQGSIVFTTTSITAADVVTAVTSINSGSAALVV